MSDRRIIFSNARLIDPASGLDAKGGLVVEDGKIAEVGAGLFADIDRNNPMPSRAPSSCIPAR